MPPEKLKAQELAFVQAYCTHGNMTQAVYDAGWKPRTRPAAAQRGHELLRKPAIAAAVKNAAKDNELTIRRLFGELITQVFSRDISQFEPYMTGEKSLKELAQEGANLRLIKKARYRRRVSQQGDVTVTGEIELVDGQRALEMLARHLGMFQRDEQAAQSGPPPVAQSVLADVRKRMGDAAKKSPHPEARLSEDD